MTSTPTRPVDNVVIATKGLQDRSTNIIAGTTVENKGKLILSSGSDFKKSALGDLTVMLIKSRGTAICQSVAEVVDLCDSLGSCKPQI